MLGTDLELKCVDWGGNEVGKQNEEMQNLLSEGSSGLQPIYHKWNSSYQA